MPSSGGIIYYARSFRGVVSKHKDLLKGFLEAREKALRSRKLGEASESRGVKVTRIRREGNFHDYLYSVELDGKRFFVKEINENKSGRASILPKIDLADAQIKTLQVVKSRLEGVNGVEVANYHFAWRRGNSSFLVTEFYEGETLLKKYGDRIPRSIQDKLKEVSALLSGMSDFHEHNIIETPNGRLVIFDLCPKKELQKRFAQKG